MPVVRRRFVGHIAAMQKREIGRILFHHLLDHLGNGAGRIEASPRIAHKEDLEIPLALATKKRKSLVEDFSDDTMETKPKEKKKKKKKNLAKENAHATQNFKII